LGFFIISRLFSQTYSLSPLRLWRHSTRAAISRGVDRFSLPAAAPSQSNIFLWRLVDSSPRLLISLLTSSMPAMSIMMP
jgi:hypothetical protein